MARYEPRPPETPDHDRLMAMETMFCDLANSLLDNGQPGLLSQIASRIEAGRRDMEAMETRLENRMNSDKKESEGQILAINKRIWQWAGGLSVIGALGAYILSTLKH